MDDAPVKPLFDAEEVIHDDSNPALVWEAVIGTAVTNRVSDVHACAQRDGYELSFRLDGDLRRQGSFSHEFGRRLIGHVKSVSGMDLSEHRRPTEGRMKLPAGDRTVDLRISAVPGIHGQDIVVRLFDSTVRLIHLAELGLLAEQLDTLRDMMSRPTGLILVAGPSGGGKTTTLYAMLREMIAFPQKIITIEDPVEYDIPTVAQTQANPRIGVTFATMLTAILRQDPDVIMVGEIRDVETAVTAVRAANTGHLVLATTHATRASRAVETLLSLGVHPYFLSSALRCVLAQVLVKRVCDNCKTPLPETADIVLEDAVLRRLPEGAEPQLWQGTGCDQCRNTGYRGRTALFELFVSNERIREMILSRAGAGEIDQAAEETGMLTLELAGKLSAVAGLTTMEQIIDALPSL